MTRPTGFGDRQPTIAPGGEQPGEVQVHPMNMSMSMSTRTIMSMETPMLYVASSWRNERQPEIVRTLRADGFEVTEETVRR